MKRTVQIFMYFLMLMLGQKGERSDFENSRYLFKIADGKEELNPASMEIYIRSDIENQRL